MVLVIILIVIAVIYYYYRKSNKKAGTRTLREIQDKAIKFEKNFSYRLNISLSPNWGNIYKKCNPDESDEKRNEFIKEMEKKLEDAEFAESVLWGREYEFTEFYDSMSGLTTRFQEVTFPHQSFKKKTFKIVDKFGEDCNLIENAGHGENWKETRDKYCLEITDQSIKNNIYDKYMGWKSSYDGKYLFNFPVNEIFNFLLRFYIRYGKAAVVKWPDAIEDLLAVENIKYEKPEYGNFETELKIFDIEKLKEDLEEYKKEGVAWGFDSINDAEKRHEEDKEFFGLTGNPKMAYNAADSGRFTSEEVLAIQPRFKNL